jgi:polysaccharide export outer membrane protein
VKHIATPTKTLLILAMLFDLGFAARAEDIPQTASKIQAPSEYRLGPEDVIEVFVWKEPDLSTTVTVRTDGRISLPLVNELDASGKTVAQLQNEIAKQLQVYITEPKVNVMVKQINSLKISVLGEVRKPDVYRVKNRVTVLDAIAMAGGFTDLARPNKVVVLRSTPTAQQRIPVDIKQLLADPKPFYLEPGDTVYVEGR